MRKKVPDVVKPEDYTMEAEEYSPEDRSKIEGEYEESLLDVGYDPDGEERSGSFLQLDHSILCSDAVQEGIEVMGSDEAIKKYSWLSDYWWRAVHADTDIYTKEVADKQTGGYFIRAAPGVKSIFPLQAGLFIGKERLSQNVHNIVIVEEGAELHIITGCSTAKNVHSAMHLGVSEFYVKEGATLTYTMIHNWAPEVVVRPRSGIIVDEGGTYINNYILMKPVKDVQMYPVTYCGKNARTMAQTIVHASQDSKIDIGSKVVLEGENSRAELVSRSIATDHADVTARGEIVGSAAGVKGHLECIGLMLSDTARMHSVPELEATVEDAELSHEAAVGRISEEEIAYLTARGLTEDEAAGAIVRGFLNVDIKGLPPALGAEVRRTIRMSADAL